MAYSVQGTKLLAKQKTDEAYLLQIQGLQTSSEALIKTSKANAESMQKQLSMTLEDAAKKFDQISGMQRAAAGSSGISIYSGSFQDVFLEQQSQYFTQIQRAKEVTKLNQASLLTEALQKAEAYKYDIAGVQTQRDLSNLMINGV